MISVREAIERWLTAKPPRRLDDYLWVSDLGTHPAKVMKRILFSKMEQFSIDTQVKMENGNALETATVQALQFAYGNILTQFPLFNEVWSGYADVVIGHGTRDVTIIEHKAQDTKYWDFRGELPKGTHICQAWLYGQIYRERYDVTPKVIIFYRAWGQWAEFAIEAKSGGPVIATGQIDGKPAVRQFELAPDLLRLELETYYHNREMPVGLPEREDTWNYPTDAYGRLLLASRVQL